MKCAVGAYPLGRPGGERITADLKVADDDQRTLGPHPLVAGTESIDSHGKIRTSIPSPGGTGSRPQQPRPPAIHPRSCGTKADRLEELPTHSDKRRTSSSAPAQR